VLRKKVFPKRFRPPQAYKNRLKMRHWLHIWNMSPVDCAIDEPRPDSRQYYHESSSHECLDD